MARARAAVDISVGKVGGAGSWGGTLARMASHAASEAMAVKAPAGSAGLSTSAVLTANKTSPSSTVLYGWIPRAIDICTCTASRCSSRTLSRWFVTTRLKVVLLDTPPRSTGAFLSLTASRRANAS